MRQPQIACLYTNLRPMQVMAMWFTLEITNILSAATTFTASYNKYYCLCSKLAIYVVLNYCGTITLYKGYYTVSAYLIE